MPKVFVRCWVREVTHTTMAIKACYTKHTVAHARLVDVKAARLGLAAMRILCAVPRMNWQSYIWSSYINTCSFASCFFQRRSDFYQLFYIILSRVVAMSSLQC